MWEKGFEKMLKEIVQSLLEECTYTWIQEETTFTFGLKDIEEQIEVKLEEKTSEKTLIYQKAFSYPELYRYVVPTDKLDYLYVFQDIIEELNDEDKPNKYEIKRHLARMLFSIGKVFIRNKDVLDTSELSMYVEERLSEKEEELIPGRKFYVLGMEYEQLALF